MKRKRGRDHPSSIESIKRKKNATLKSIISTQFDTEILIKHRELTQIEAEINRVKKLMDYMRQTKTHNLEKYMQKKNYHVNVQDLVDDRTEQDEPQKPSSFFAAITSYIKSYRRLWN